MSRLTQLAVGKRSVTLLLAAALFVAGHPRLGQPQAGAPAGRLVPDRHGHRAVPGRRRGRRDRAGGEADRAGGLGRARADPAPVDVGQLVRVRRRPVRLRHRPRRGRRDDRGEPPERGAAGGRRADRRRVQLQRRPGRRRVDRRPRAATDLERGRGDRPDRDHPGARSRIPGVASADLAGGLEERLVVTLDPIAPRRGGRLDAADRRRPPGQQPDAARRRAADRRRPDPGLDDRPVRLDRGDRGPRRRRPRRPRSRRRRASRPTPAAGDLPPPAAPTPVTLGELGTVELAEPRDDRLRPDERPAGGHDLGQQDQHREHGRRSPRRSRPSSTRSPRGTRARSTIATVADQSVFILESSDGLLREGGLGAIFAVLTIFLFLFSLRSTFVAAVSIPLSILTALVDHAGRRDHAEHHDARRPGGRRRSRGRRLDRRPREHLPPPGARRRPADGRPRRARARSPGRSPRAR